MRVLWFTNTYSRYEIGSHNYHGGGWIEALEELLASSNEVELGVAFFHPRDSEKSFKNGTTYYPIKKPRQRKNIVKAILKNWLVSLETIEHRKYFKSIIDEFRPDVIRVFGFEGVFCSVIDITSIPVVVHIQGLLGPVKSNYFPYNMSKWNFILSKNYWLENLLGFSPYFGYLKLCKQAEREISYVKKVKYVMGRTDWDRMYMNLHNPKVLYFKVNEVLRGPFYNSYPIDVKSKIDNLIIVSTLSSTVYKGIDVVLKAAKLFQSVFGNDFEWQLIGIQEDDRLLKYFENELTLFHKDVNVTCIGRKTPLEITRVLGNADIFVHPSYIENSPNSICEAQMLGLPVIASNVGGVSTLIEHGETGFLVPPNGLVELSYYLNELRTNVELRMKIVSRSIDVAKMRHEKLEILGKILDVYKKII